MTWLGSKDINTEALKARWQPSLAWFRKGSTNVTLDGVLVPLTWHFEHVSPGNLGFAFIQCHLEGAGTTTEGQGYALNATVAMRQAFAEAWERLWVIRAANGHISGVGLVTSSNGFAAGATDDDAIAAARGELIERALLLAAWRSRSGWQPRKKVVGVAARLLAALLRGHGWSLSLFRLDGGQLGSVLAGLARHEQQGAVFDTVYLPDSMDDGRHMAKLVRSLLRSTLFTAPDHHTSQAFPLGGKPEDHAFFYRQPSNAAAFAFLDGVIASSGKLTLPEPESLQINLLASAGLTPAVAVATHPTWPTLSWGQHSIDAQTGPNQEGGNPWPHPLA